MLGVKNTAIDYYAEGKRHRRQSGLERPAYYPVPLCGIFKHGVLA